MAKRPGSAQSPARAVFDRRRARPGGLVSTRGYGVLGRGWTLGLAERALDSPDDAVVRGLARSRIDSRIRVLCSALAVFACTGHLTIEGSEVGGS